MSPNDDPVPKPWTPPPLSMDRIQEVAELRSRIRLVKCERDVKNSSGCPWCDIGREPERIGKSLIHPVDHMNGRQTYDACTKANPKTKVKRAHD